MRVGLLVQPQFLATGNNVATGTSYNIYVRRIRLILGGTIFKSFEYFFETDYPNLFLDNSGPTGLKNTPGMNVQDVMITYKPMADMLKIDAGYMLPPLAHNAIQSAASLYGWDYFTNTFNAGNSFGTSANPFGRDVGVQARGLLMEGHVEYRVGVFQGFRGAAVPAPTPPATMPAAAVGGQNRFRVAARLQINLLDPESGFFYGGTYLGAKRILSVGGSYDFQGDYKYWAVDGLLDMPVGPGVATAQFNVAQWNPGGGNPPVNIPKETAIMAEAGFHFLPAQVSPIVRYEHLTVSATSAKTTWLAAGLAFWPFGHTSNVKTFYQRVQPALGNDFNQFIVQWQIFFY